MQRQKSPERGGDEQMALLIATKFPHVLYDDFVTW